MNFRECRQTAMLSVFRTLEPELSKKKNFLVLGGMRNAYYSFNYQGIEILGLCGCYEINVPGIFELFDIKYETIPANEFWEVFKQESVHEDSHFILPFVRDVVNTEDVDLTKNNLIGASY